MSWPNVALEKIVKISKGKKHNLAEGEAKHRYIQIDDLRNDNLIKYTDDNKGTFVDPKDVIIAWDGANAGTIGYGLKGLIGSTLARLSIVNSDVDTEYLGRFLQSRFKEIRNNCTGATIPHVSKVHLISMEIPLPPLAVQKQIAAVFEKADTLRSQCQQMEQELNTLAQSVFLDMFGDPVTNPKGWKKKRLLDICSKVTDGTHQTPEWADTGIPFLFISNVRKGKVDFNTNKFITERCYNELTRTSPIEVNDILYTTVGSYGHVALVDDSFPKFCFQRHIAHIKPDAAQINPSFLYYQLQTGGIKHLADKAVRGIAQKTLNLKDLKGFNIVVPPIELQDELVIRLSKIRQGLDNVEKVSLEKEELFNSLMQRAFKGELELKDVA